MARRDSYGSVEGSSSTASLRGQQSSHGSDPKGVDLGPYSAATSGGLRSTGGRFPLWRAAIVTAAAATALCATVGVARFSSISAPSQHTSTVSPYSTAEKWRVDLHQEYVERQDSGSGLKPTASSTPHASRGPQLTADAPLTELVFVAFNEYTRQGEVLGVGYPWLEGRILVEPYRQTTLDVVNPLDGMTYDWTIVEQDNPAVSLGAFTGPSVEVVFKTALEYTVTVVEKKPDGTTSRITGTNVISKYVRREIRSLSDAERNEVFDAMKVRRWCLAGCNSV